MGIQNYYDVNEPPKTKRIRLWVMLIAIVIIGLVLGTIHLFQSDQGQRLLGTGTVMGMVVDESDKPLEAEIYVLRTDIVGHTDANGVFQVRGVPSGLRSLVVTMNGGGLEYPVTVNTGGTTDMGRIKFIGTRVPGK